MYYDIMVIHGWAPQDQYENEGAGHRAGVDRRREVVTDIKTQWKKYDYISIEKCYCYLLREDKMGCWQVSYTVLGQKSGTLFLV